MIVSMLLKSWATPVASWPTDCIFWDCRNCSSRFKWSAAMPMQPATAIKNCVSSAVNGSAPADSGGRWDESGKSGEKVQRGHDPLLGATVAEPFDPVGQPATRKSAQPVDGKRWARSVTAKALAAEIVVGRDGYARLDVEACALHGDTGVSYRSDEGLAVVCGVRLVAQRVDFAPSHRDRGAGVERALSRVVDLGFVPPGGVVATLAPQPRCGAPLDMLGDSLQLGGAGGCDGLKSCARRSLAEVHAIEHDHVKVHVQVQAGTEALHKRDGAAEQRPLVSRGPSARAVAREDGLDECAREGRQDVGAKRGRAAPFEGQREHPLAHGHGGQARSTR